MATTDAMARVVLGTDRVREWRPGNYTDSATTGFWLVALVAGAAEHDSEHDAELDRDLACCAVAGRAVPGHIASTVVREMEGMGQRDRMARWSSILRGDVTPTDAEREAYQQWTGEEWGDEA